MRSRLLPTTIAAVLVTLHTSMAIAKMNDRLAQKLVVTDEGASPPGDYSGREEYSGGELGWGDGTSDDAADVADGEGDLLRGQAPDGGDGGDPDEGGACFDTGDGEPTCVEPAAGPGDVAGLNRYDLCTGCTLLAGAGCGVVGILCWSADALTVGGLTIPCGIATIAACGGALGGMATCTAMCS